MVNEQFHFNCDRPIYCWDARCTLKLINLLLQPGSILGGSKMRLRWTLLLLNSSICSLVDAQCGEIAIFPFDETKKMLSIPWLSAENKFEE